MTNNMENPHLRVLIIGSSDFRHRLASAITMSMPSVSLSQGGLAEAWTQFVSLRPDCVLVETGLHHNDHFHDALRKFLEQMRCRNGDKVYVIAALSACEKFYYGGDLLFEKENSLNPSCFVDTFIAQAPSLIPSIPSLGEQAVHALRLCASEMERRAEGLRPIPPLGDAGWVQSLADPLSRELWMVWLPRYASYTNENPIIIGETGTGKTNLAKALHLFSKRKGDFVSITPRDFSSSELVQAELFGAVSGAYTGAVDKWGLVKSAEKGTLFIDELQSIDKDLQGKIITFIENKAYRRVGSAESISADVRFVFASNRALYDMMESNILRHDFAYRLERVQMELPSLSKRKLDIPAALAYAMAKVRRQRPHSFPAYGFTSGAYRLLFSHNWPGNLRQLENCVAQLCELGDMARSQLITEEYVTRLFETRLTGQATNPVEIITQAALSLARNSAKNQVNSLEEGVEQLSDCIRKEALEACGGDVIKASSLIRDDHSLMKIFANASCTKREFLNNDS